MWLYMLFGLLVVLIAAGLLGGGIWTIVLIPVAVILTYLGWPFFWRSFMQNEQSSNAGGLPVYPAKLLIPLAFTFLLLQGISELIKRIAIIRGEMEDTVSGGGHHAAAEAEAERLLQVAREEAKNRLQT